MDMIEAMQRRNAGRIQTQAHQLQAKARHLAERLTGLAKAMEERPVRAYSFNAVGEVQGQGGEIDRMMGELTVLLEQREDLTTIRDEYLRVTAATNAAASTVEDAVRQLEALLDKAGALKVAPEPEPDVKAVEEYGRGALERAGFKRRPIYVEAEAEVAEDALAPDAPAPVKMEEGTKRSRSGIERMAEGRAEEITGLDPEERVVTPPEHLSGGRWA